MTLLLKLFLSERPRGDSTGSQARRADPKEPATQARRVMQVERLGEERELGGFGCGNKSLDDSLKLHAMENQRRNLSRPLPTPGSVSTS